MFDGDWIPRGLARLRASERPFPAERVRYYVKILLCAYTLIRLLRARRPWSLRAYTQLITEVHDNEHF